MVLVKSPVSLFVHELGVCGYKNGLPFDSCLNILGGLDPKVTDRDLYSAFIAFGEIIAVHLPRNSLSNIIYFLNGLNFEFFSRQASRVWICRI